MQPGAEAWFVPISKSANGLICSQVSLQPLHLGRAGIMGDFTVEDDDMPGAQVVGVIPLAVAGTVGIQGRGGCPEVCEIASRTGYMIVVVAR